MYVCTTSQHTELVVRKAGVGHVTRGYQVHTYGTSSGTRIFGHSCRILNLIQRFSHFPQLIPTLRRVWPHTNLCSSIRRPSCQREPDCRWNGPHEERHRSVRYLGIITRMTPPIFPWGWGPQRRNTMSANLFEIQRIWDAWPNIQSQQVTETWWHNYRRVIKSKL